MKIEPEELKQLREELKQMREELKQMRRKQAHGCTDAFCPMCDGTH